MTFFGIKYKQQISATGNGNPLSVKIWESVEMLTNNNKLESNPAKNWSVVSATIPASKLYPLGMKTIIPASRFGNREGKLYAEFLKDQYTPMAGTTNYKLVNGRDMRGEAIEVLFENDDDKKVLVSHIKINSVESKS